jgi:hypothetical protein
VNECAALPCEAVLTVARTGGFAGGVSIDFATADGTATALNDYTAMTGTLNFPAGVVAQTIRIPLQIEPGAEATKTFSVLLSNPRGGATLGPRAPPRCRFGTRTSVGGPGPVARGLLS